MGNTVREVCRRPSVTLLIFIGWIGIAGTARGQSNSSTSIVEAHIQRPPKLAPTFDVVSIKPYGHDDLSIGIAMTADRISATGMSMHMIIREALGVTNDRLVGEPDWVNSARFNFEAKIGSEDLQMFKQLTSQQRWAMFLPVLEDRCKLRFHHEVRTRTVYVLTVSKGGTKLRPSVPSKADAKLQQRHKDNSEANEITIARHGASMGSIVRVISLAVGSTVIDETGLKGSYDYELDYAPDQNLSKWVPPPGDGANLAAQGGSEPSIFTALNDQLGLKLKAQRKPVDVVVIDHIEPPSPN